MNYIKNNLFLKNIRKTLFSNSYNNDIPKISVVTKLSEFETVNNILSDDLLLITKNGNSSRKISYEDFKNNFVDINQLSNNYDTKTSIDIQIQTNFTEISSNVDKILSNSISVVNFYNEKNGYLFSKIKVFDEELSVYCPKFFNVIIKTDNNGKIIISDDAGVSEYYSYNKKILKTTLLSSYAYPDRGYRFKKWSDGITTNPRTFHIISDIKLSIEFAENKTLFKTLSSGNVYFTDLELSNEVKPLNDYIIVSPYKEKIGTDKNNILNVDCSEGISSVGNNAFWNCKKLSSIDCPKVETIGQYAFDYCTNLSSINCPNVKTIGQSAFSRCWNLSSINCPNVKTIGQSAFAKCSKLSSIDCPNVTYINEYAFYECSKLSSIDCPKVETIGQFAFYNCTNLSSINCPNVKTIGQYAFYNCTNLSSINCPNVKTIGQYAFYNCTNLSSINCPNVGYIDYYTFDDCTNLRSINCPNVTYINEYAFDYCSNLSSINCPSVEIIGGSAFSRCWNLSSINCPNVKNIYSSAFSRCWNLSSINCPKVETIDRHAFQGCQNLRFINCQNVKTINWNAFYNCTNLSSINCPNVETIGGNAFYECSNLSSINCPNVETISGSAFEYCTNLSSINCPNVETIGGNAFWNCDNLKQIILSSYNNVVEIQNNTFNGSGIVISVYVPTSQIEKYISTEPWKTYYDKGKVIFI